MINASKEFKEKLKKGENIINYADITLSNGDVLHLTYKDFMIGGCSIEDKTTDGKFGVGYVVGKTLTIRIANHDEQFSQYDFYNAIIHVCVAMAMDNGTIEKIRKGVYYATVPSTTGEIIEISAVDGMFLLDRDYSASTTVYPASLQTIITDACLACGIPVGFRQFDNMGFMVQEKPEKATCRQVVSWACQVAGYNARIDNDGYMQLIWYNSALLEQYNYEGGDFKVYPHDIILDGGNFKDYAASMVISGGMFTDPMPEHVFQVKSLNVHTDDVQITGVRVIGKDDKAVLAGEEGYLIEVSGNPFVEGKEHEVANYLRGRMVGMSFRPFTAQVLDNPLYEPFEVVRVSDRKGNVYLSVVNSVSYTVGSYTQIACVAEDPVRNGSMYYSAAAAAVVEERRRAERELTDYDRAVQNMNQLAMNAMGYHTTYEDQPDGSRITYLHDRPLLKDSKTIYKQTIDGFFISTDGGESYTAGFDKNGNAVVNILYAIGIVADWIRTGRFECRKGDKLTFLADVDTGEVRIVADSFSLSNGETIQDIADGAVNAQTQSDIFNKLTNDGQVQGIYLRDGKIYINGSYIQTGTISVKKGNKTTFLANADTGRVEIVADSFSLSDGKTIESIAQEKAKSAVNAQTQLDIFNKLTNDGQARGIWLKDGQLYISFSYSQGGTLTLGGSNNERGNLIVLGDDGNRVMSIDKDGIYINDSSLKFTITGDKIENTITLTAIIGSSKYVTNINPSGASSFLYALNESNEWELRSSTSQSGSTVTVSNASGYRTNITADGVVLSNNVYFYRNRLNIVGGYFSQSGIYLNNESVYLSKNSLTLGTNSFFTNTTLHCAGTGYFDSYLNSKSGTSILNALNVTRNMHITGNLSVSGTKSRKVKTKNYSERLLYCCETSKPYFSDIGEAMLDENGICYVFMDDIFLETINTGCQYQAFLQKYGQGDIWVEERGTNYFLVKGTPGLRFGWELKARQAGFEAERLESFVQEDPEETIDYEKEAQKYIDEYYKEVLNYEEGY